MAGPAFEKHNHHFIPRFWLRGFADAQGSIWKRQSGRVTRTGAGSVMNGRWLYTLFNDRWEPSDALENALSLHEGRAAAVFKVLKTPNGLLNQAEWELLLMFLGVTATRHPLAMTRGRDLAKELAFAIADVHSYPDEASFCDTLRQVLGADVPAGSYAALVSLSREDLESEAAEIAGLSPQDMRMPEQQAILGALPVANAIAAMDLEIVDAPGGCSFILSDCPLPLKNLGSGFSVPLASTVALRATPSLGQAVQGRSAATLIDVDKINAEQVARTQATVIASERFVLDRLTI